MRRAIYYLRFALGLLWFALASPLYLLTGWAPVFRPACWVYRHVRVRPDRHQTCTICGHAPGFLEVRYPRGDSR